MKHSHLWTELVSWYPFPVVSIVPMAEPWVSSCYHLAENLLTLLHRRDRRHRDPAFHCSQMRDSSVWCPCLDWRHSNVLSRASCCWSRTTRPAHTYHVFLWRSELPCHQRYPLQCWGSPPLLWFRLSGPPRNAAGFVNHLISPRNRKICLPQLDDVAGRLGIQEHFHNREYRSFHSAG